MDQQLQDAPEKPAKGRDPFPDGYLGYLLARASHLVNGKFHKELAREGVQVSTWRILTAVLDCSRTVTQLADIVLMKQPTLSKALGRLEAEGLVKRLRLDEERRVVLVEITPEGKALATRLRDKAKVNELYLEDALTLREMDRLKDTLHDLIERFP